MAGRPWSVYQEERMDEIYHVKFRACPTNYNPIQYVQFSKDELRRYIHLGGHRGVEFTEAARRECGLTSGSGYVIFEIYTENGDVIVNFYTHNGYAPATVTEALKAILLPPKKVISADSQETAQ